MLPPQAETGLWVPETLRISCDLLTNRPALSSFVARRRPIFICCGSNAVSVPGRPLAAQ
jgi:hypothetical protein